MTKFIWFLQHMILPLVIPLVLLIVGYYSDLGGVRSAQFTASINDIETAVNAAYERCVLLSPAVRAQLVKAEDYKWLAIEAREAKDFKECRTQIGKAVEHIQNARDLGCPEIYVPRERQWWERVY